MLGKFLAKCKEIGISKTKDGLPQVVANFTCYPDDEAVKNGAPVSFEKTWFSSLKGDAAPITLQTLAILDYKFSVTDLSDIAAGMGINFTKEVEIIIGENTYNGKTTERINGVFEVGSAGFSKLKVDEAVNILKGVDISATVLNFMQLKGISKGAAAPATGAASIGGATTAAGKETPF